MIVHIQCFGQVRTITKEAIVPLEVPNEITISKAIDIFVKKYGEDMEKLLIREGKLRNFYSIQVDRKNVDNDLINEVILSSDQTISIIPFVAGG
jgi:molybdopterin converting factor small subunit